MRLASRNLEGDYMTKKEIAELVGENIADVFDVTFDVTVVDCRRSHVKALILSSRYIEINIFSDGDISINCFRASGGHYSFSASELKEMVKVRKKFMHMFQD
jgi:hypothetical protein